VCWTLRWERLTRCGAGVVITEADVRCDGEDPKQRRGHNNSYSVKPQRLSKIKTGNAAQMSPQAPPAGE